MSCTSSAIELNDCGVCSMIHHKYEEATGFFRSALSLMREDIQHLEEHPPSNKTPFSARVAKDDTIYENVDIEFYESSRTSETFQCKSGCQGPMRMCKMAVTTISPASMNTSTAASRGTTTKSLASAVIHNLAITTHLW